MAAITRSLRSQSPAWMGASFGGTLSHVTAPVQSTTGNLIHKANPSRTAPVPVHDIEELGETGHDRSEDEASDELDRHFPCGRSRVGCSVGVGGTELRKLLAEGDVPERAHHEDNDRRN
jgi:hypothetical protein